MAPGGEGEARAVGALRRPERGFALPKSSPELLLSRGPPEGVTVIPLVDTHCHLLAGLDDGPRTAEDALAMCRIAVAEGVRMICATAHQNPRWEAVTPDAIRAATRELPEAVRAA